MEKFIVTVTETLSRQIEVEAENSADAVAQVEQLYNSEDIVLDADDFDDVEFTEKSDDEENESIVKIHWELEEESTQTAKLIEQPVFFLRDMEHVFDLVDYDDLPEDEKVDAVREYAKEKIQTIYNQKTA